jgi:hypothetical protein
MNAKEARNLAITNNGLYKTIKVIIRSAALTGNTQLEIHHPSVNLDDFIEGNYVSTVVYNRLTEEGYFCDWNKFTRILKISF